MLLNVLTKLQYIDKLTIGAVILQILSLAELHGVSFPQFKIKTLTIEYMVVRSVILGIFRLLQNSPGLKKITIHTTKCKTLLERELDRYLNTEGLYNDRCWSRSVNLTRLEITGRNWIRQLAEIVAPHIHYLSLKNFHKPPTLVDVSSLTEANFNIEYKNLVEAGTLQDMVLKLLAKLQNVEKLTIGTFALQILSLAELRRVPFPQLKIKSLTVETMPVRSVIPGIIRLLQNSPGLEEINVDTTDEDIPDKEFNKYLNTQEKMVKERPS
ncbi:hypothetical protein AALP_AA8G021700 [Arabis alpina]|uniref:FBD domain-containing protein n=1 Tax=Arabis alpina TaxID=50452 RepID=A0A087G4F8_ARAAL|nr:hypothetical protein AALP_AA8G021700 [Arabis alpina]